MSIAPGDHAARLIGHYLKHLTVASGKRWTSQNDADMALLGDLLDQVGAEGEALDSIPAFDLVDNRNEVQPPIHSDRTTVVFDREPGNDGIPDPIFQKWRGQRQWSEDDDVRRLVRR